MTTNQLIDQLATDAYIHSSGIAKYPATMIYKANIQQLKDICEAYHQAKCAESYPVAECVTNPFNENAVCAIKWIDDNYTPRLGDKLFAKPQASDAEAKDKLKVLVNFLRAHANGSYTTYSYSGKKLKNLGKQALEKIGES